MSTSAQDSLVIEAPGDEKVQSSPRTIPGSNGIRWQFELYPIRRGSPTTQAYIRVTGGSANIRAWISAGGTTKTLHENVPDGEAFGFDALCPVSEFRRHFNLASCLIKIEVPAIPPVTLLDLNASSKEVVQISVGTEHINIARGFLIHMSPVFATLLQSAAPVVKVVSVDGFSLDTVRDSLNYTFGLDVGEKTEEEVVKMIEFAHRYEIGSTIEKLEQYLTSRIAVTTFSTIASYAWKYDRGQIQTLCGKFFCQNEKVAKRRDFTEMDAIVVVGVLKASLTFSEGIAPEMQS